MNQPVLSYLERLGPPAARPQTGQTSSSPVRRLAYWDWVTPSSDLSHAVVCVHGLSRQGRDFDTLARRLSPHVRVICVDAPGRGQSDWLEDPMAYQMPVYVADMMALLHRLAAQGVTTFDWVGTSMGGLIGMLVAAQSELPLRRLVLNDVGPAIEPDALLRIGEYLGKAPAFDRLEEGADYLWSISRSFGPHTPEQWKGLSEPMFRRQGAQWVLHYDPAIAAPFKVHTAHTAAQAAQEGQALLWQVYETLRQSVLLLRGAESDLLSEETAHRMSITGPRATRVDIEGVGHAPTLVAEPQLALVQAFLLSA
ncbi:alpha/beta fold hydrolase [Hydrogenophaga soli]|nr:alpha/beta hydrolase [Burkholderiaceae bacterium]